MLTDAQHQKLPNDSVSDALQGFVSDIEIFRALVAPATEPQSPEPE